jgi:hypothetical protein
MENFAAVSGIERSMAFRFLRVCTKIGLTGCEDGRSKAMVLGSRGQYLIWSEFLSAVRTNQAQGARALGAPIFDYYADHPDEAAIFRATMQDVS